MKKIACRVLAVCSAGLLPLFLLDLRGLTLVIGQVDSGILEFWLLVVILLTLLVWGDVALAKATRGWERGIALTFVLAVEGIFLVVSFFFLALFNTSPRYVFLPVPEGKPVLVALEESWLQGGWGRFLWQVYPGLLKGANVSYITDDGHRPFERGEYELEWNEESVTVYFDTSAGWDSCVVPLP